jgi:hypothetical protein
MFIMLGCHWSYSVPCAISLYPIAIIHMRRYQFMVLRNYFK